MITFYSEIGNKPIALDDSDWVEVFGFAGDPGDPGSCRPENPAHHVDAVLGSSAPTGPVLRCDVKRVIAFEEGEGEGPDWLIVVKLDDGRFAFLTASTGITGWEVGGGGHCMVSESLSDLITYGMGDEDRARLGLVGLIEPASTEPAEASLERIGDACKELLGR